MSYIVMGNITYIGNCVQIAKGPQKGQIVEVVKRKLAMEEISGLSLRYVMLL